MKVLARVMRRLAQWPFGARSLSTLDGLENAKFLRVLARLESAGWRVSSRYGGIDAGIDYDSVRLKREGVTLRCEWDPAGDWRIEGPTGAIQEIALDARSVCDCFVVRVHR